MGNCCEVVDYKLEEMLHSDDFSGSTSSLSLNQSLNSNDFSLSTNNASEEPSMKLIKYRNAKNKLKTIIEDHHEDVVSSPFLLKGVN